MQRQGCQLPGNLKEEEEEQERFREEEEGGDSGVSSNPTASMTDAEAQSAPPSAPVEDEPQPERKVIGGCRECLWYKPVCGKLFRNISNYQL